MGKIKFLIITAIIAIFICITAYHFDAEGVFKLPPVIIAILKSIAATMAVMTALAGIWAFSSEHFPNVRIMGARMNDKKTLITIVIKNYSKTTIKKMAFRMVIFESKIKDETVSTFNDVSQNWFGLMPAKQRFSVLPLDSEQIVVNLNRLPVEKDHTMDIFKDHVFILAYLEFSVPLLLRTFKERSVLAYDRQHNEWFVASEYHNEMKTLFREMFSYLEKDDLDGLVAMMDKKDLHNKATREI